MKRKLATLLFIIIDIGIIIFSFLFVAWLRDGTKVYIVNYARSILAFGLLWLGVGLWGRKFTIKLSQSGRSFALQMLKIDLITIALIFGLIMLFQLFHYSRYIVFGTIGLTIVLELLFFVGLYFALKFHKENDILSAPHLVTRSHKLEESFSDRFLRDATKRVPKLETGKYEPEFSSQAGGTLPPILWKSYLDESNELYDFVEEHLDLAAFDSTRVLVKRAEEVSAIAGLTPESLQIFIDLHRINDFRRINQFLIKVNSSLVQGGVFICCVETISQRRNRFVKTLSPFLGFPVYGLDFIYHRVLPKIPVLQGWYFALTRGRDRALSETEMIGRFFFCGFDLVSKDEVDGMMYFIMKKVKPWSEDPSPSYGPLIKLRRIGRNGEVIYINKLRTMHPYSEYLQDYVYRASDLQEGGKFTNDFRVTSWGRVLRSLWIDELPQIYNFLRGEVSLVGVRALSEHYYNLYPPDLQQLRCKFKPGLVPPFYADMPKTFEEILASERRYLEQKTHHPYATDWKYFLKACWNILFKHARSQ